MAEGGGGRYPATSIVVLSGFNDHDNVVNALNLGAMGFIPKSAERAVMLGALNLVLAGGTYIPPDVLDRQGATAADRAPAAAPPAAVVPSGFALARRQAEVLAHMMRGLSNKAICRKLDLAERTVMDHALMGYIDRPPMTLPFGPGTRERVQDGGEEHERDRRKVVPQWLKTNARL